MKRKVGSMVMIASDNDNECYEQYHGLKLRITHRATSTEDHPGYDASMAGMALYDLQVVSTGQDVPFSLYDYEVSSPY